MGNQKRFHLDFQELYFESTADFNRYCAGDERISPHYGIYRGTEAILYRMEKKELRTPCIKAVEVVDKQMLELAEDLEYKFLGITISKIPANTAVLVKSYHKKWVHDNESEETKLENCFVFFNVNIVLLLA